MPRLRYKYYFEQNKVLYCFRYDEIKDWVFICGECLKKTKILFENSYQYGGTGKSKKK